MSGEQNPKNRNVENWCLGFCSLCFLQYRNFTVFCQLWLSFKRCGNSTTLSTHPSLGRFFFTISLSKVLKIFLEAPDFLFFAYTIPSNKRGPSCSTLNPFSSPASLSTKLYPPEKIEFLNPKKKRVQTWVGCVWCVWRHKMKHFCY